MLRRLLHLPCFVLCIAVFAVPGAFAATEATPEQLDSWSVFNGAHDNQWRIEWDSLGMPSSIIGGSIAPAGQTPEEIARNFLAELTGVFAIQDLNTQLQFARADTSRHEDRFGVSAVFKETINSLAVINCCIKVHINQDGTVEYCNAVADRLYNPVDYAELSLDRNTAIGLALSAVPEGMPQTEFVIADSGYLRLEYLNRLVWQVFVPTSDPGHSWCVTIDQTGQVIEIVDAAQYDIGLGYAFFYNPDDGSQQEVALPNLDGSHYLIGTYADVMNKQFGRAYEEDNDFRYNLYDQHFEDASAYYHVDYAYNRFCQMGFSWTWTIRVSVREFICGPYYVPVENRIYLGKAMTGCQNQAWDGAVIYHETTHHISYNTARFDYEHGGEPKAISEAISDYFSSSWTNDPVQGEWVYPAPIRNLDNDLHYPEDWHPTDMHYNSQILSGALWDIRGLLPVGVTDDLTYSALTQCTPEESFTQFWEKMVLADRRWRNSEDLRRIYQKFHLRGITPPTNTSPVIDSVYFRNAPGYSNPKIIYEDEFYRIRAAARQDGSPDGKYLDYDWIGDGQFSFGIICPPDSLATWLAPVHQPGQSTPVERSIIVVVYDGLGGADEYTLGPFLVFERPDPCFCGGAYPTFGDVDCSGGLNPTDVVTMVNFVYKGMDARCYPAGWSCAVDLGDVDCDNQVGPIDVVYFVNYVYKNYRPFPCDDPCQ